MTIRSVFRTCRDSRRVVFWVFSFLEGVGDVLVGRVYFWKIVVLSFFPFYIIAVYVIYLTYVDFDSIFGIYNWDL